MASFRSRGICRQTRFRGGIMRAPLFPGVSGRRACGGRACRIKRKATQNMQALRTRIDTLIAGGSRATKSKSSDGLMLKGPGKSFVTLMTPAGVVTKAGRVYEDRVGERLPAGGYDVDQAPRRVGNVEYIKTRGGKDRVVRRWDPSSDKFVYTALGRTFYSKRQSEYVVQIPITIRGKRDNGRYLRDEGLDANNTLRPAEHKGPSEPHGGPTGRAGSNYLLPGIYPSTPPSTRSPKRPGATTPTAPGRSRSSGPPQAWPPTRPQRSRC